jgi:hypothetical protein
MGRTGGRWEMVVERGPNRDWNFQPSLTFFSGLCPCSNFGEIISFSFFFFLFVLYVVLCIYILFSSTYSIF